MSAKRAEQLFVEKIHEYHRQHHHHHHDSSFFSIDKDTIRTCSARRFFPSSSVPAAGQSAYTCVCAPIPSSAWINRDKAACPRADKSCQFLSSMAAAAPEAAVAATDDADDGAVACKQEFVVVVVVVVFLSSVTKGVDRPQDGDGRAKAAAGLINKQATTIHFIIFQIRGSR